ncbi:hypothetical protein [Tepidibacillus marianensis]|uniref:hypothetical protein n=1 Tax=Tepidibacillus marianensis TaxID=3131995 RepID=UPI0030D44A9B
MKNKTLRYFLLLIFIVVVGAASVNGNQNTQKKRDNMTINYKIIEETDAPIQVNDWLKINRSKETHIVIEIRNKIFIIVTRGEKIQVGTM